MLLSNLNLLATAPGGVPRLRELILTLAMQGKLVPQDPSDEPASELLLRINQIRSGVIHGKSKSLPISGMGKSRHQIPENWALSRFEELFSLEYGDSLPAPKRTETGEYPVYGSNGVVGTHNECRVNAPCIVVGRKGSAGALNLCLEQACWVTDVAYFCVPPPGVDLVFAFQLFHTLGLDELGKGIKPGLSRSEVYSITVAIPPFAEQRRIVTRVEELMRLCDALEAKGQLEATQHAQLVSTLLATLNESETPAQLTENWYRIATHFDLLLDRPEAVDALEQTILQLAVRGLLVPQDLQDEPASELLKKIRAEKDKLIVEGKIKRDKPLPPIAEEEKPFELPQGWEWVRLGWVTSLVTSGSRSWKDFYATEGATFIRSQDIKFDRLEFDERAFVKLPPGTEGSRTQVHLKDLLITITGANVGKAAIVAQELTDAYVSQHVALVRFLDVRLVDYFHHWLVGEHEGRRLLLMSSYGAKPGLNLQNINDLLVPVPPLAEQSRIVARVASLRALCADLRQRLFNCRSVQEMIASSLLTKETVIKSALNVD
ncbi:hypothetical protein AEP_00862 [Curvibacter sp. AEP1-3]|uniref:restriction endonuclease subunit S n=1 Tax=Curvibacter sp. AEP1-3 TaxID=1844971 RepID=UPI000B3C25CB|nr:restriction endonuclease subunit S [Curvibacter sp. AEP1-3]ARV17819.1 hypothetical protein AEP_00862 [Curvibacter sp. AEP1-3]